MQANVFVGLSLFMTVNIKEFDIYSREMNFWVEVYLILLHFALSLFTEFFFSHKWKARPSTREKSMTGFIAILTVLRWSRTDPGTSKVCLYRVV